MKISVQVIDFTEGRPVANVEIKVSLQLQAIGNFVTEPNFKNSVSQESPDTKLEIEFGAKEGSGGFSNPYESEVIPPDETWSGEWTDPVFGTTDAAGKGDADIPTEVVAKAVSDLKKASSGMSMSIRRINGLVRIWCIAGGLTPRVDILDTTNFLTAPDHGLSPRRRLRIDLAKAIVGHTTSNSVTLWFCRHGNVLPADSHYCEVFAIPPGSGPVIADVAASFSALRSNTAVVEVTGLKPASRYGYRLSLIQSDPVGPGTALTLVTGEFTTAPVDADRLRLAFSSCHTPTDSASLERWRELRSRDDYELLLLIGDQIYESGLLEWLEGEELRGRKRSWREAYAHRYHQYWAYPEVRDVLRKHPTYMILDDHEIMDDWGTEDNDPTLPAIQDQYKGAMDAYRDFQQSHNPGRWDGRTFYDFRWGNVPFFVMDLRTYRDHGKGRVFGEAQYEAMQAWAKKPDTRAADVIMCVLPVPIAWLPVAVIQDLVDKINQLGGEASFGIPDPITPEPVVIKPGSVEPDFGKVLAEGASLVIDEIANLFSSASRYVVPADYLTKWDLADDWTERRNQEDMVRILDLLFDLASEPEHPRLVFLLSGDIHFGSANLICSRKTEHRKNPQIFQLTSSPLTRTPPVEDLFSVVRDKISPWQGFPLADTVARLIEEEAEDLINNPDVSGFVLDSEGEREYRSSLLGFLPARNYGRVHIERIAPGSRKYRCELSLQAAKGLLPWTMEVDLNAPGQVQPMGLFPIPVSL